MQFFRQYISPLLVILICLFALVAVTIRSFLPSDLAAPAPIEDINLTLDIDNYNSSNLKQL